VNEKTNKNNILFDFLESINYSKKNIMNEQNEKFYIPHLINGFLSCEFDSIFYVNEISKYPNLDKKLHYDFLRLSLSKRKRYNKFPKRKCIEHLEIIKKVYKYNDSKALEALRLLNDEQIESLKLLITEKI